MQSRQLGGASQSQDTTILPAQTRAAAVDERESGCAIEWVDFLVRYRNAHLVSARIEPVRATAHLQKLRKLLDKTIEQAHPASAFATTIVRLAGALEIQCGFAQECDADKLRRLVRARHAPARAEWSSHHSFRLDAAKELALSGGLEPGVSKSRSASTSA
jgi:hypothetical protein